MAKGKVVCIYSAKGGTGKTTFVLSLAGVLANNKKKVLIIDLNLTNGAVACLLNKDVNHTIYNFYDDYNNNRYDSLDNYLVNYNEYIDFISAPKDPRQAGRIDSKYLDILIDKCIYKYDVILLDNSANLDEIVVSSIEKADYLYLITTNDLVSLKNLKNLLNILDDYDYNNYHIVLNESIDPNKNYFSLYDIKSILSHNVDYHLSSSFYYKKIDDLYVKGDIITLKYQNFRDYKVFDLIAKEVGGLNE